MAFLLEYQHQSFWDDFKSNYWLKRPVVLKQPFIRFPFQPQHVREALDLFRRSLQQKSSKFRAHACVGGAEVSPESLLSELFTDESSGFFEIENRLKPPRRPERVREIGLMLNNVQSLHPEIWRGVTAFQHDLYQTVHGGFGNDALMDLFMGNYRSSFLKLHKDRQDVFSFITAGNKTMYAWPFETLAPYVTESARNNPQALHTTNLNYLDFLDTAIRLDGQPGDVIYWPADYWHIAEGDGRSFSAVLNLGLFWNGESPSLDYRAEEAAVGLDLTVLRWQSGFGYAFGLHLDHEDFPRNLGPFLLTPAAEIRLADSALLFDKVETGGRQYLAANGLVLGVDYDSGYDELLGNLRSRKVFSVEQITAPFESRSTHNPALAYFCDPHGIHERTRVKFKTRKEEAIWLLGCLLAAGGLTRVPTPRPVDHLQVGMHGQNRTV